MTDIELDDIERKAREATSGKWRYQGNALVVTENNTRESIFKVIAECISKDFAQAPKDAEYIAAVSPAVILELIAELKEYRLKHLKCS